MNRNIKLGGLDQEAIVMGAVAEMMRDHCYVEGRAWYKFMEVTLKPGEAIKPHKHAHHLVMYYPEAAETIYLTPEPGTILYLPPGTMHQVPRVKRARKSIAMLIDVEKS